MGWGFTLIELLIVVVIISFLGSVAAPALLSRLAKDPQEIPAPAEPLRQAPPSATVAADPAGRQVRQPVFVSSTVDLDVQASHALEGFRVFTRYDAAYSGTFVVRNMDPVTDTITLAFPFPPNINEARDVSLQFRDAAGGLSDAPGVRYGLEGIEWTGQVPPGEEITAVVSYTARGRDALTYDVVGSGRSGAVRVDVRVRNAPRVVVPASALQPAEREGATLRWRFESLITSKPIVIELPAGTSPLGRVILVLQLAGVAVLLFGGGFWYLSEGQRPGRLDDFRWGHFFLLALNYSLFFAIFAVLGYRGSSAFALSVAALVSLPLLMLHVLRITDVRFAFSRVLPLAMLTSATVVGGVFLDEQRPLVLLGASVVLITFLTLSYSSWLAGRVRHSEGKAEREEKTIKEAELADSTKQLSTLIQDQEQLHFTAQRALDDTPVGFEAERTEAHRLLALHENALAKARAVVEDNVEPQTRANDDPPTDVDTSVARSARCIGLLEGRGKSLKAAVGALGTEAREARNRLREGRGAMAVALGEAAAAEEEARGLMEEAGDHPELKRVVGRLAEASRIASRQGGKTGGDIRSGARALEHHTTALGKQVAPVREVVARIRTSIRRAEELEGRAAGEGTDTHCLRCGEKLEAGHHFCALCGTPRPLDIDCPGCGTPTRLPQHMLGKGWRRRAVHCSSCGDALPSLSTAGQAGV